MSLKDLSHSSLLHSGRDQVVSSLQVLGGGVPPFVACVSPPGVLEVSLGEIPQIRGVKLMLVKGLHYNLIRCQAGPVQS